MSTVDEFDFYTDVLHSGNRMDFELMGDDWASWAAGEPTEDGSGNLTSYVTVYDDDDNGCTFTVVWKEII